MDVAVTPLTLTAAAAAVLLAPALISLLGLDGSTATGSGQDRSAAFRRGAAVALTSAAAWALVLLLARPELDARLVVPGAALSALAGGLVAPALRGRPLIQLTVLTAVWSALVYSPVAIALFSLTDGVLGAGLRTLDLGGALPVAITVGCGILTLSSVAGAGPMTRPTGVSAGDPVSDPIARRRPGVDVLLTVAVLALWILWLVGLELVIDGATARIASNAVIAPLAAAVCWLLVTRMRRAAGVRSAARTGVVSGLAAITAGCAYLDPAGAVVTGAAAGLVTATIALWRRGTAIDPLRFLGWVLVVASSTGVILLGALATRSGLIFTGHPEVLLAQSASVALVVVYSTLVSTLLALALRAVDRRASRAVSGGR